MRYLNQDGTSAGYASASYSSDMGSQCSWCGKGINVYNPNHILCYGWGYFDCMECFEKYRIREEQSRKNKKEN